MLSESASDELVTACGEGTTAFPLWHPRAGTVIPGCPCLRTEGATAVPESVTSDIKIPCKHLAYRGLISGPAWA